MKHINESIIGRKRMSVPAIHDRTGLREGDIIYFKFKQEPYVVVLNPDIYKQYMNPKSIRLYDCSDGVFLKYPLGLNCSFMVISDYNDNLEYLEELDSGWDIKEVKRRPGGAVEFKDFDISPDDIDKKFITVFKEGKWRSPYGPKRK